jgi:hypothetical protein
MVVLDLLRSEGSDAAAVAIIPFGLHENKS